MQYSFDYCQQLTIPYSSQQRGTIYFRTPRKVQVFGVCCEQLARQVFFLTDEAEQIGKGAVAVVSQLHAFFHLHGLGEKQVTLQSDNCAGQNKNQTMMWYLAWRIIVGLHDRIELNFMLPGHTKFRPDAYFALLKKCYKRQNRIDDLADLAECVRKSGRNATSVPQLYKDWEYYDWTAFLSQWFAPQVGHSKFHLYAFDKGHPGIMKVKVIPGFGSEMKEFKLLKDGITTKDILDAYSSSSPCVITPKGNDAATGKIFV